MDLKKSREFYEQFFSEGSQSNLYYPNQQRYEIMFQIIASLDLSSDSKVLEVGSGSGRIAKWLDQHFDNVVAIDIGEFEQMKEKIKNTNIEFAISALPNLPFKDQFDLVICSEVIEHLPTRSKQQQAVAELASVLSKFGIAVISTPNPRAIHQNIKHFLDILKNILSVETNNSSNSQMIENWISPMELQSFLTDYFTIRKRMGSYYCPPDLGTGLASYLRPISDYITINNILPNRGLYQYYVAEVL